MLKCVVMNGPTTDDIGKSTRLVASQLRGIGDKLNIKYAENEQNVLENNLVVQHGVMAVRVLCLASCAAALFLYIRNY